MAMVFEWDHDKDLTNQKKHDVSFSEILPVFDDPRLLSLFDEQHSREEDRWISFGQVADGTVFAVVHTVQQTGSEEVIRIISVRQATDKEEKQYYTLR
jgi:hypothetical protein